MRGYHHLTSATNSSLGEEKIITPYYQWSFFAFLPYAHDPCGIPCCFKRQLAWPTAGIIPLVASPVMLYSRVYSTLFPRTLIQLVDSKSQTLKVI